MAGSLKRDNPEKSEDIVLIRALRDSNIPKFLADDAELFLGILGDLFPGLKNIQTLFEYFNRYNYI